MDFNLDVADSDNGRTQLLRLSQLIGETVARERKSNGLQLELPADVIMDGDGYLYIADNENHRIQRFQLIGDGCGKDEKRVETQSEEDSVVLQTRMLANYSSRLVLFSNNDVPPIASVSSSYRHAWNNFHCICVVKTTKNPISRSTVSMLFKMYTSNILVKMISNNAWIITHSSHDDLLLNPSQYSMYDDGMIFNREVNSWVCHKRSRILRCSKSGIINTIAESIMPILSFAKHSNYWMTSNRIVFPAVQVDKVWLFVQI